VDRDLVGIAEGRPRLVLEIDAVKPHGDGDAADKGRVVLADQDHGCSLVMPGKSAKRVCRLEDPAIHPLRKVLFED
jgi:hypothetical protein